MTTTPAALSEQTLAFTRMLVGANLAEGIATTIPSGDLYNIIDELLRLRSRPNEGMREALKALVDATQCECELYSKPPCAHCVGVAVLALPAAAEPK